MIRATLELTIPALDSCHPKVVHALQKAGWAVQPKPFLLLSPINNLYADIEAHRRVELEEREIIIVEAKCFPDGSSTMAELYTSIGQYLIYQAVMEQNRIPAPLFLAIPSQVYYGIFQLLAMSIVSRNQIKLLVIDLVREEIEQWVE